MNNTDLFPGRLLYHLQVTGITEHGGYFLSCIEDTNTEESNINFYLPPGYTGEQRKLAEKSSIIEGPFVVLKKKKKGLCRVALCNYDDILYRYVYPNGWKSVVTAIPWRDMWNSAYRREENVECRQDENRMKWHVHFPSRAIVPVRASNYLQYMKGQPVFCPQPLSESSRNYCVYRTQTKESWPRCYECTIDLEGSFTRRKVKVFLHGMADPLKIHYNIRKHMGGDRRAGAAESERDNWNKCAKKKIPEGFVSVFSDCVSPHIAENSNQAVRCSSSCKGYQFSKVNNNILDFAEDYYSEIVTFFQRCPTNVVEMFHERSTDAQMVEFKLTYGDDLKVKSRWRLILSGWCFNWSSGEPIVHLQIVTFFAATGKKKKRSHPYNGHLRFMGKMTNVEEVR